MLNVKSEGDHNLTTGRTLKLMGAVLVLLVPYGCVPAGKASTGGSTGLEGALFYVSPAATGRGISSERLVAIDVQSGASRTVFENSGPYSDDESQPRIVGYMPASGEIVLKFREAANETTLLAQKVGGQRRVLAKVKGKWVTAVYSSENSVGVVLRAPGPLKASARVWGSEAAVIRQEGGIKEILAEWPIAGEPTCSSKGTCYVPVSDLSCEGKECDDFLVRVEGEQEDLLDKPRGMGHAVSPDGRWVAIIVRDKEEDTVYRLFDNDAQRWGATLGPRPSSTAIWSPDGRFLSYTTGGPPPTWRALIWNTHGQKIADFEVPYRINLVVWGSDAANSPY